MFAPIIVFWFLSLLTIGILNISRFDPFIIRAIYPLFALRFLSRHGFSVLGGILLCITGVEALFADLGHYNRQSIQWTFTLVVYPSLMIAYCGQAAALSVNPEWITNTFYNSIPGGSVVYWGMFILATMATITASQAMILGVSSIV